VAAFGLRSGHALTERAAPPGPSAALIEECERNGTLGLLGEAVRAGALALAPDARGALELRMRAQARHDLSVELALLRLGHELTAAGLEWRAVGSAALARTAYPRAELRSLDHAQVLVDRADAERARAIAGVPAVATNVDPVRTLPYPRGDLLAPPYRFPLGGYELATVPMPQRLVLLCVDDDRAMTRRVAHLRDVAEVVVREQPPLVDVLLLARAWGCESELVSTLVTTWDVLALTEDPALVTWARTQ
jgi:hypothetical protein